MFFGGRGERQASRIDIPLLFSLILGIQRQMNLQRARLLDRRLLLLHAAQRVFSTRHFIGPHAQIRFQFGRCVEFGPLLGAVDQRGREGVDRAVHCFDLRRGLILRVISIARKQTASTESR